MAAAEVHDGYFSIDRKGGWTNTAENNQANRDDAERAYNLIMKEKEKLLSTQGDSATPPRSAQNDGGIGATKAWADKRDFIPQETPSALSRLGLSGE